MIETLLLSVKGRPQVGITNPATIYLALNTGYACNCEDTSNMTYIIFLLSPFLSSLIHETGKLLFKYPMDYMLRIWIYLSDTNV